jgi:hypothetical protein
MTGKKIQKAMQILGSDGGYIGKVDAIDGKSIRVAYEDPEGGGDYHFLPMAWVKSVDEAVHLNRSVEEMMQTWETGFPRN